MVEKVSNTEGSDTGKKSTLGTSEKKVNDTKGRPGDKKAAQENKPEKAPVKTESQAIDKKTKPEKESETKQPDAAKKEKTEVKKADQTDASKKRQFVDEKIYTIPLRKAFRKPRTKRAPYAMRLIESYLKVHAKASEVKIGKHLNEEVWINGRKNIPRKVRVKAVKEGSIAKVELIGRAYVDFVAQKKKTRPTGLMDRMKKRMTPKEALKQKEEEMIEGKKKPEETKPVAKDAKPVEKKEVPKDTKAAAKTADTKDKETVEKKAGDTDSEKK